jgi:hypothetical protein
MLQVKPQERKELCGGREGQTTYYVERKALRCDPGKATLFLLSPLFLSLLKKERPDPSLLLTANTSSSSNDPSLRPWINVAQPPHGIAMQWQFLRMISS